MNWRKRVEETSSLVGECELRESYVDVLADVDRNADIIDAQNRKEEELSFQRNRLEKSLQDAMLYFYGIREQLDGLLEYKGIRDISGVKYSLNDDDSQGYSFRFDMGIIQLNRENLAIKEKGKECSYNLSDNSDIFYNFYFNKNGNWDGDNFFFHHSSPKNGIYKPQNCFLYNVKSKNIFLRADSAQVFSNCAVEHQCHSDYPLVDRIIEIIDSHLTDAVDNAIRSIK